MCSDKFRKLRKGINTEQTTRTHLGFEELQSRADLPLKPNMLKEKEALQVRLAKEIECVLFHAKKVISLTN